MAAPLAVTIELELDGVWTNITTYARLPLSITRGRKGEQASPTPSTCTFTVNNRDGRFSPRNPTGAYYGAIGRGTPLRVSVDYGAGATTRFHGEVAAWPIGWDYSEGDIWATITAAGIRRRLSQGQTPLRSALERAALALTGLAGYWPMTDPTGSLAFASATGGDAADIGGAVDFATNTTAFPDLDALPTFQGASAIADLPTMAAGTVEARALVLLPSGGGGVIYPLITIAFTGGSVGYAELAVLANTGQLALQLFDSAGAFIVGASTGTVDDIRDRPVTLVMSVDQNGANLDLALDVITAAGVVTTYTDSAATLTLGTPATIAIGSSGPIAARAPLDEVTIGQLTIAATESAAGALQDALTGYAGETAADRIDRLCTEEGVTVTILGDAATSAAMGPQLPGDFLALIDEAATSDGGILSEDANAFVYRTRENLYDQTPTAYVTSEVTIDYAAKQLDALEPVEDDLALVNDLTVTREGGSSARYELTTGALSTQDPPDGVGRYDSALTLSLYGDDQLADQASWRVHLGTVDEPRYPTIGYDLTTTPLAGIRGDLTLMVEGDALRITNPPTFAGAPDDIRALLAGWSETITNHRWQISATGIPATPYDVGVYDDEGDFLTEEAGSRYSPDTCVLAEDLTTVETGADVTTTGALWTAADQPFDLWVGGERVTVTAVTGAANPQTLTLTRSVNGVVKTHLTGAQVRLWQPAVYAL